MSRYSFTPQFSVRLLYHSMIGRCQLRRRRTWIPTAVTLCCSSTAAAAAAVALPSPFLWSIASYRQCRCFSCSICRSRDIDGAGGRYWLQTGSLQEITVQLTFHGIQFIVSPSGSVVASNGNKCGIHSAVSVGASVRRAAACSCQWVRVSGELQRAAVSDSLSRWA